MSRGIRGLVVGLVALGTGLAGTGVGAGAAPSPRHQTDGAAAVTSVPAAGVGLTPEVAAVPASSAELDDAQSRLDDLLTRQAEQTAELADVGRALAADRAEQAAVRSLAARREAQVDKAETVDERTGATLRSVGVDRFVNGDHLLEGLDPALSTDERARLERRLVLGQVATTRLLGQRRHTVERVDQLRGELDGYRRRDAELEDRITSADDRRSDLERSLAALGPEIVAATATRDRARVNATVDGTDMSVLALDAYWRAAQFVATTDPTCSLTWPVLAGIGRTESRHGTYLGATLGVDGVVAPPIYGPDLDGSNRFAVVPDSDGGGLDGTARTDRAVGPMQFLPSTWDVVGTDLTGDGSADPQNLFDAAAAAAVYLCRSGPGLDAAPRLRSAILTYNRSEEYADLVTERAQGYGEAVRLG